MRERTQAEGRGPGPLPYGRGSVLIFLICGLVAGAAADTDFERGMALARTSRWMDARAAFEDGERRAPLDKRFPLELAGIAFKQRDFPAARRHVERALRLDPRDSYANDFLATLYLLDGNLEAALKYWNRVGKPEIEDVKIEGELHVDPVLLDRAFLFSRGSVLERRDLLTTRARLELLGIFGRFDFEIVPIAKRKFDVAFRAIEKNDGGTVERLVGLLRGAAYQAVYPEFFNLGGSAVNIESMLRWDAQKRRAFASLSAPLRGDPKWRYRFYADGRKETWNIVRDFRLEKIESGAEIQSIESDRWNWKSGVHLASRSFRGVTAPLFADGVTLKYRADIDYQLLRLPERRLTVASSGSWQLGRMFASPPGAFSKSEASVEARWHPGFRGEDLEMTARYGAGKTLGRAPFDELFMLGIERDNDLWLRGHAGTRAGKKGSAPLGRDYLLFNWEADKPVYKNPFFRVSLGPFLDSGKIYGDGFGSRKWLWDAGAQCKLRTLGAVTLVFSYGKDLRSGGNAFYTWVGRK